MTNTTTTDINDAKRDKDSIVTKDESRERVQNRAEKSNIEHVKEKGLPPGIEANDLFNPNGNRPRGVPNGDNS